MSRPEWSREDMRVPREERVGHVDVLKVGEERVRGSVGRWVEEWRDQVGRGVLWESVRGRKGRRGMRGRIMNVGGKDGRVEWVERMEVEE